MTDGETEDWMENEVENLMERFEKVGTPIKGGKSIVDLMRAAYLRGRNSKQLEHAPSHDDSNYGRSA